MYNFYQQQPNVTQMMPQQPTRQPTYVGLKGHPVSSLDEVKATSIDFDGSIFYFPDIANKRIYTKVVDLNGIAQLNMYELKPLPSDIPTGDYVTRQEFEQALAKISELLAKPQKQPSNHQESPSQDFKEVF